MGNFRAGRERPDPPSGTYRVTGGGRLRTRRTVYLTAITTLVLMVAATAAVAAIELLRRGDLNGFTPSDPLWVALLIGGPVAYLWISQRRDAEAQRDQAEDTLRQLVETEARLGFLADHSSDLFVSVSAEGRFSYISPNARRYGYAVDDLLGEVALEFVHPDDRGIVAKALSEAFQGDRDALGGKAWRFLAKDGEWRWCEASPILRRGADGRPFEIAAVLRDVTDRKAADDAIVASEMRYRLLADTSTDVIARLSLDDTIEFVSPSVSQLGYEPEELIGAKMGALLNPEDRDLIERRRAALVAGRSQPSEAIRLRHRDGHWIWMESNRPAVVEENGVPVAIVLNMRDVSDRTAAEQELAASEANFRLLAENASDVIARCDRKGILTYISPSSKRVFGYEPAEVIGTAMFKLINPDDGAWVSQWLGEAIRNGVTGPLPPQEYQVRKKSGELIWVEASPSIIRDPATGRLLELQDTLRDISARKAMEEELRRKHAEAEAAAIAKADFLANVSHELRTPLTGIIGFSSLLEGVDGLPPTARTFVQRISSSSRALLGLVSDVLDFSRMDAGQMVLDPRPADLEATLREAIEVVDAQAQAKSLAVRLEIEGRLPRSVMLDSKRFRQVVLNLLSNALKFTDRGEVVVRARYVRRRGGVLAVSVSDTGVGIPEGRAEHLFERFTQADDTVSRRYGGTGLGLSICRAIVELMGGTIHATSVEGQGATFSFDVLAPPARPLEAAADRSKAPPATARAEAAPGGGAPKVLIVDDVALNRELIKTILTSVSDMDIAEAEDGLEAVDLCRNEVFDAILMDLRMPGMGGLEATRTIRAECHLNRDTPIVAVSANNAADDVAHCLAAGMNDHISKPLAPAELIEKVAHWTQVAARAA